MAQTKRKSTTATATANRSLCEIAREIRADWTAPYFGAVPYLSAMQILDKVPDSYGYDNVREIVVYFLVNANTWRGPVARRVKAELRAMLKR